MAPPIGRPCFTAVPELPQVGPAERDALLALPPTAEAHASALARLPPLLARVEIAPPPRPVAPPGAARVAFWNAERGKFLEESVAMLGGLDAAALLLCELDVGMARSGQRHVPRELARRLDVGYAFAVEFVELGLGDAKERDWHAGAVNERGLHGAAILSRHRLERPAVIRLELDGGWFDGRRGERRVGGRMAVAATLEVAGVGVALVSVHFESHGDPDQRAAQMATLLDAIDAYAPQGGPVLIGGDFNTSTIARDWGRGTGTKPRLDPGRVRDPIPHEPLFGVAAARGYDWRACNVLGAATQRTRPDGTPEPPLGRLDWFFARGLRAADPAVVPAVGPDGGAISDHEVLVVTVAPDIPGRGAAAQPPSPISSR